MASEQAEPPKNVLPTPPDPDKSAESTPKSQLRGIVRDERPEPPPQSARRETSSINKAIEEVHEIIRELTGVLDSMNKILDLLEDAERDKSLDEQEIQNLRRQLSRIQRPREHFRHQQPQHFSRHHSQPPQE